MSLVDPPLDYYKAIADSDVEAWVMHQQQIALRRMNQGG